jgi:hypothetical protein
MRSSKITGGMLTHPSRFAPNREVMAHDLDAPNLRLPLLPLAVWQNQQLPAPALYIWRKFTTHHPFG